jgi:hypothetical protein
MLVTETAQCSVNALFWKSGDDIGNKLVFEHHDFVLKPQFALFEARKLQLIGYTLINQRGNGRIEIAVFAPDQRQTQDYVFVFNAHSPVRAPLQKDSVPFGRNFVARGETIVTISDLI